MVNLIGRKDEQVILRDLYDSNFAEFLVIYGRRRIGKTYLVKQFFSTEKCFFFNATGIKDGTMKVQLDRFVKEISRVFYKGVEVKEQRTWLAAFDSLTEAIEKFLPSDGKIVIFLDEFPWMATHKSGLLQALDYHWNRYWSHDIRIKLIICGSSASWIVKKIINNKAGLHNRITRKIHLMPFNLEEVNQFLIMQGIQLDYKQITKLYMTTGGVPYYLKNLQKGLSAVQHIEKLAFQQNSLLLSEFDNLFSSLFDNAESYVELLRAIAQNRTGLNQDEIISKTKFNSSGGTLVKKLSELEEAGFIISFTPHWHKKRGIYYRLIDEYTLFYMDWIEPVRNTLQKKSLETGYWQGLQQSGKWHVWAGYAFEAICYKHLMQIRKKLQIAPTAIANSWRYAPIVKSQDEGAQIDLLFDRADDVITLCEMKYTNAPFEINKDYAEILKRKIKIFRDKTRTKKQIFFTMISANGLKETMYAEEMIQGVVVLEDLFS